MQTFSERMTQAARTDVFFPEPMTLAVRTDGNFFGTDDERFVHGFPCKNGKPLVYVFA